jgi:predicted aspartyl protease
VIRGTVNVRREAIVPLRLRGPGGGETLLDAIVDSGFSGALALPVAVVAELALQRQSVGGSVLADGSVRQFEIYAAEVAWSDGWRPVLVSAVSNEALLGMRLLANHELHMAVVPSGDVVITPLP